jgi:hypothetical protein
MLQNRVDPSGKIIRTKARGAWMGNRGLLHNERQEILRPFRLKAWITCVLEFKDRKRSVMAPGLYTELFFLDEATSFSAGHRPCFECRRSDAMRFKSCWIGGNPEYGFDAKTPIGRIDAVLHRERLAADGSTPMFLELLADCPNGSFVVYRERPHIVVHGWLYPWSPEGYGERVEPAGREPLPVLTPRSIVNAFRAGYLPQIAYLQQSLK